MSLAVTQEDLLHMIGKLTMANEVLLHQLKEAREYNQSGTQAAAATSAQAAEARQT